MHLLSLDSTEHRTRLLTFVVQNGDVCSLWFQCDSVFLRCELSKEDLGSLCLVVPKEWDYHTVGGGVVVRCEGQGSCGRDVILTT